MGNFLMASWKALAAGLVAGAAAFQAGQNLGTSAAVGVGAFGITWIVPNKTQ